MVYNPPRYSIPLSAPASNILPTWGSFRAGRLHATSTSPHLVWSTDHSVSRRYVTDLSVMGRQLKSEWLQVHLREARAA